LKKEFEQQRLKKQKADEQLQQRLFEEAKRKYMQDNNNTSNKSNYNSNSTQSSQPQPQQQQYQQQ